MKNAILALVMISVMTLTVVTVFSIENTTTRKNELDANLGSVMKTALEKAVYSDEEYSNEELKKNVSDRFLKRMSGKGQYNLEFIEADVNKGILSVKATAQYPSMFSAGSVSCKKTALVDRYDSDSRLCSVTFYESYDGKLGKFLNPVKKAVCDYGDRIQFTTPEGFLREGYRFVRWDLYEKGKKVKSYDDVKGIKVSKSMDFVAYYEKI